VETLDLRLCAPVLYSTCRITAGVSPSIHSADRLLS
jgi:hypothetical protein